MAGYETNDRPLKAGDISRRSMMATAVAASAFARPALAQTRRIAPSDKVNVAIVGAGGQGANNAFKLLGQNIVATSDVDYDHVRKATPVTRPAPITAPRQPQKDAYDKAARFTDYRRMFDEQKGIDAVVIATPDHHHAVAARMAMERGLHVYVQKPLTYTNQEGRRLLQLARANPKLVLPQMGNVKATPATTAVG